MAIAGSIADIAERLRQARDTTGYSTREVSRKLQEMGRAVSHTTVANFEARRAVPSIELLDALAVIYERSRDWFYSSGPSFSGIQYRALKAVRVADKRKFEGESLGWMLAYIAAEQKVNDPAEAPRDFRIKRDETGAIVARRIRDYYKFGDYPIPSISRLAENFGIRVIQLESQARIDGMAAMLGSMRVVVVNTTLANDRLRMNLAHELAHHLFQDCLSDQQLDDADIERRAMECASHLLIPDGPLRAAFELQSMVRLVQYKERYGISLAAMIFRARQSGLLSERLYKQLWIEFGRLGWRKDEPGYVPPDRPVRMEALFDAAIEQRLMSIKEIATLAGVDERVVRQRVMLARGGAPEALESGLRFNPMRIDHYRREQSEPQEL
jgi:Zn-dependent peptidase ImmA (M78 family)